MNHAARVRRLQTDISGSKLDYLLVTHLPNVRYLTGFTGSAAALLVGPSGATLFTDGRYIAQAKQEVANARIVIGKQSPIVAARAAEKIAVGDGLSWNRAGIAQRARPRPSGATNS